MKNIINIISILLLAVSITFGQASNVSQEIISTAGAAQLILDLGTEHITIKSTKGSRILVETNISLSTPNEKMLDFLISSGRYSLIVSNDPASGALTITRKRNLNILIVKGVECVETYSYVIFVPESISFTSTNTTVAHN